MRHNFLARNKCKTFLILNVCLIFFFVAAYVLILKIENDRFRIRINLLFQDEVGANDFTYLGRRLGDLERQNEIACILVKLVAPASTVAMYQTLYKPQCESPFNGVFSFKNTINIRSLNGAEYSVSYNFLFDRIFLYFYLGFAIVIFYLANFICFFLLQQKANELKLLNSKIETLESLSKIASHFIHDIKSPLSLFNVLSKHHAVDSGIQESIKMAYDRVLELINKLSDDVNVDISKEQKLKLEEVDLTEVVALIVSEKMLNHEIQIRFENPAVVKAKVNKVEFKRVISNLLENAIEASESFESKSISVVLKDDRSIEISDSGKGIPQEILASVGKRGFTYGKERGTGLGVFHAIQNCKQWGAKLSFTSNKNAGTKVIISF